MSRCERGAISRLAVGALLMGSILLLGCQPAQPAATPQPPEKGTVAAPTKAIEKAAATPAKAAEKPVRGGTVTFASGEYGSLDPQGDIDATVTFLIFDMYVFLDKDTNPTKEGLFKDWTISADGKTITFKLREGVKFHDGTDFDAAAVKFNIERVKDPATKSPHRSYFASVASVEVVDILTARFNLSRPDAMLLASLGSRGGMVVSPAAVKKYGQDFGRNPVGTGPFRFVEWASGDHASVKRFDGYWKKDQGGNQLPYLDGVVFRFISDQTVAAAAVRTGQAHTGDITVEQWPMVKSDPNLTTQAKPGFLIFMVLFNNKRPPFDNKALREAVALAVDREGIASVMGEAATSHASVMTPVFWGYDPKVGVFPDRDLAKAKAKMAEAGYPGGGGLKVKLSANAGNSATIKTDQVLQTNLAEIGIQAEIETVANVEFMAYVTTEGASKYQILPWLILGGSYEVGHSFNNFFHSQGARNNLGPYSNPQVDELIEKAGSVYDQKERAALYQQAAKLIRGDVPVVPLYISNSLKATSVKVRNLVPDWSRLDIRSFAQVWLAQ